MVLFKRGAGFRILISVIIRSKDEADRLRLTLGSLRQQSAGHEVIVVDDGSTDHTQAVLNEEAVQQSIRIVRHAEPKGRAAASNAGAGIARGKVLLFMDGDTLAGPSLLSHHGEVHAKDPRAMARGDVFNLRCTRILLDPDAGTPQAEHRETLSRRPEVEIQRMRVSMAQVLSDFDAIDRRAERGVYPGAGPRRLAELEMRTLSTPDPDCTVAWAAASGSNFSVNRERFLKIGGFDERLDNNEHRELALRLQRAGDRLKAAPGARSYHLTHRSGWRDPIEDTGWETIFLAAHPEPTVALLIVFWASLSQDQRLAPELQIRSLEELQWTAEGRRPFDHGAARCRLGAPNLAAPFWAAAPQASTASPHLAYGG